MSTHACIHKQRSPTPERADHHSFFYSISERDDLDEPLAASHRSVHRTNVDRRSTGELYLRHRSLPRISQPSLVVGRCTYLAHSSDLFPAVESNVSSRSHHQFGIAIGRSDSILRSMHVADDVHVVVVFALRSMCIDENEYSRQEEL